MSGEDFIILPNGKKIYIKDTYGKVKADDFESKKMKFLIDIFNRNFPDGKLYSSEIGSLFSSVKDFAQKDGNNELSSAELLGFIKENVPEDYVKYIKPKDMIKFIESVQEKSEEQLAKQQCTEVHIDNTFNKIFPELNYFEVGADNNIDTSKISFNTIKKRYPEDKYEIKEESEKQYVADYDDGRMIISTDKNAPFEPGAKAQYERTYESYSIINRETGEVVVEETGVNGFLDHLTIKDETNGRSYSIYKKENGDASILSYGKSSEMTIVSDRSINIKNGKVDSAVDNGKWYIFDNGVIEELWTREYSIPYTNGIPDKDEETIKQKPIRESMAPQLNELLSSKNIEVDKLIELVNKSINSDYIGEDMDDYYSLTGNELIDDIQNSNLPQEEKTKLLNSICEPYVDSKYYDAHKKIENSKVDNPPYYTSEDTYDIQYNGPIITILNKTSGETIRINLKTLIKDMDYYGREKYLKRSLKAIQNFSGEVLENMNIEIAKIIGMSRDERYDGLRKMKAGAFFEDNIIHTPTLHRYNGGIIVHEMSHGIQFIDETITDNPEYIAARDNFTKVYNECIEKYEALGHKRFDDMHPMRSIPILPINKGINYATYNENEAFAISMQIIFGYKDSHTKFVKIVMPELVDAARELYLTIRKLKKEERRTNSG